tara:strand:+ start:4395 stop:5042 length:648 start_codon:yes stop_codon:yes gene_type:complete
MNLNHSSLVVCGTDTGVGKTIISSLLVQGLNGIYWKPIQSGLEDSSDTKIVSTLLKLPQERWIPEVYKFKAAVSPHWAAEKENQCIDPSLLKIPSTKTPLIIETAGGLMVPINRNLLQINQLKNWGLPIILVARSGLGTLNHTLLSLEALKKRLIPIIGIVLNGPPHQDNAKTLEQFGKIPILAHIPHLEDLTASQLQKQWNQQKLNIVLKKFKQ